MFKRGDLVSIDVEALLLNETGFISGVECEEPIKLIVIEVDQIHLRVTNLGKTIYFKYPTGSDYIAGEDDYFRLEKQFFIPYSSVDELDSALDKLEKQLNK